MKKRFRLVVFLGLLVLGLSAPSVYADSVILTGGSISTGGNAAALNLTGTNFSLNYSGDIPGGSTSFAINSFSLSLGSPLVIFNGVSSDLFKGFVSFDNLSVTGSVTAYGTANDLFFNTNPLFTVTFSGNGSITVTELGGLSQTQFTVSTPASVPEPATFLQLFAGLGGSGAVLFRRYARTRPS